RRGKHARIDGGAAALIGWQLLFALSRRTLRCPAVAFLTTGVRSTTESTEITERCRRSPPASSASQASIRTPWRNVATPFAEGTLRALNASAVITALSAPTDTSAVTTPPCSRRPQRLRGDNSSAPSAPPR